MGIPAAAVALTFLTALLFAKMKSCGGFSPSGGAGLLLNAMVCFSTISAVRGREEQTGKTGKRADVILRVWERKNSCDGGLCWYGVAWEGIWYTGTV